jgi:DNA-binding winged helix-turn-helix (wHTH) protein
MLPLTDRERVFRFGAFELSERPVKLRRRGSRVDVRHQCLELLLLFVERAGTPIARDEIRRHLWRSDQEIDHHAAINTTVSNLRRALGDDRSRPLFIETLPKRGYCFIAPVEVEERRLSLPPSAPSRPPSRSPTRFPTRPATRATSRLREWLAHLRSPWIP